MNQACLTLLSALKFDSSASLAPGLEGTFSEEKSTELKDASEETDIQYTKVSFV